MKRVKWENIKTSILGVIQKQRMLHNVKTTFVCTACSSTKHNDDFCMNRHLRPQNAKTTFVGIHMSIHFLWLKQGRYTPSKFVFCDVFFASMVILELFRYYSRYLSSSLFGSPRKVKKRCYKLIFDTFIGENGRNVRNCSDKENTM